jgi:hypothetical protein
MKFKMFAATLLLATAIFAQPMRAADGKSCGGPNCASCCSGKCSECCKGGACAACAKKQASAKCDCSGGKCSRHAQDKKS